jgi:hypothetical protein
LDGGSPSGLDSSARSSGGSFGDASGGSNGDSSGGSSASNRRLAWCYGDFGVSLALLSAAHACGRDDWRDEALAMARDLAAIGRDDATAMARDLVVIGCDDATAMARDRAAMSFDEAQVFDTGLCHGAAGAVHLFVRLHHATGDAIFAEAARRWVERLFAMRRSEPIAGFPMRMVEGDRESWRPSATLLEGAVGVGLALHAAISEIEPSCDRLLLVDIEPLPTSPR